MLDPLKEIEYPPEANKYWKYTTGYRSFIYYIHAYMSRDTTKPTKWVCAQRRLRSAWASQGFFMRTAKTLIRLGRCPGWSEVSLGAQPFCWFCHVAVQSLWWFIFLDISKNGFSMIPRMKYENNWESNWRCLNKKVAKSFDPWKCKAADTSLPWPRPWTAPVFYVQGQICCLATQSGQLHTYCEREIFPRSTVYQS